MPSGTLSRTPSVRPRAILPLGLAIAVVASLGGTSRAETPKVPEGFQIRLVAAVPAVKYPCQVATAPDGSLFVGEDPMDQVGPADKPIDNILLFRPGKDEPIVFAENLSAIFGMVWHDGALYVMNMPNLTVLRDTDGDGKADQRTEIFKDMGVPAGFPNMLNDHIVSGIQIGIDDCLYIAVGDKGVPKATGPDGRSVQLKGGGVIRCRLDGTGLEVFSSGTRNHLEPNLDARDNLFTYDNTDDGLGWWTRVTHHIDGGYYGYPYDYHDRTDRMLRGWPSTAAARLAAVWSTMRTPGPRNTAAGPSGPSGASASCGAFRFEPKGASFKVERRDRLRRARRGRGLPADRPGPLARRQDDVHRRLVDGRLGQQEREARPRLRRDPQGRSTRPRGPGAPTPIRSTARSPSSTTRRSWSGSAPRPPGPPGQAGAGRRDGRPGRRQDAAELAKRHLVWVLDGIAGGTPEAAFPLIAALDSPPRRRPRPRPPGARRASGAGGDRKLWSPGSRTPSPPSGSRRSSPWGGSATRRRSTR